MIIKKEMLIRLLIPILLLCSILTPAIPSASALEITGPEVEIKDNNIIVNSGISNVKEFEETIKSGVAKEIVFTIELLKVWRLWPDEFVVSRKITRVIKFDNLREQYRVSSSNGTSMTEKHFKDYNVMKDLIFIADKVNLANIRELDPGKYYIRVVVESRSTEQSPVVGFLMNFIPEVEMSLAKESEPFIVKGADEKP